MSLFGPTTYPCPTVCKSNVGRCAKCYLQLNFQKTGTFNDPDKHRNGGLYTLSDRSYTIDTLVIDPKTLQFLFKTTETLDIYWFTTLSILFKISFFKFLQVFFCSKLSKQFFE